MGNILLYAEEGKTRTEYIYLELFSASASFRKLRSRRHFFVVGIHCGIEGFGAKSKFDLIPH